MIGVLPHELRVLRQETKLEVKDLFKVFTKIDRGVIVTQIGCSELVSETKK